MSRICQVFGRDFYRDFMKRHLDAWWLQRPAAVSSRDKRRPARYRQAAFRLYNERSVNRAAIFMRLLASTAAATHSSKRSRPSARQRFMPRPRNSTEMRPSMPARKRWPALKTALLSYATPRAVLLPPRCGMHTSLTPARLHDAKFCSLKKPRSEPYSSGARPKARLWHWREDATWTSSGGFPFSTSYCVIKPSA